MHLILASKSPRRREILASQSLDFTVLVKDTSEDLAPCEPGLFVEELARRKGTAVTDSFLRENGFVPQDCIVLSCDTVVYAEGEILGKPHSYEDGYRMLRRLSGKTHSVMTGYSLLGYDKEGHKKQFVSHETTRVTFGSVADEELVPYLQGKEPYDKAGGYAIQGKAGLWVQKIEGCYYNVVGLPLFAVMQSLYREFGFSVSDFDKKDA